MPARYRYPLGENHPKLIRTATGLPLDEVTLTAVIEGRVNSNDLTISSATLLMQAELVEELGYSQLGKNLRRASEITRVPPDIILRVYGALRPHRSTFEELQTLAGEMEDRYEAKQVAQMMREAADIYRRRGLLRSED